jgi:hypothetical protein
MSEDVPFLLLELASKARVTASCSDSLVDLNTWTTKLRPNKCSNDWQLNGGHPKGNPIAGYAGQEATL